MSTTQSTRTDRYGFPVVDCYRCGGSGSFSYNQLDGSRCYGCGGTGVVHKRGKVAKAAAAHRAAQRAHSDATLGRVQPGDKLAHDGVWKLVESVAVFEDDAQGWSLDYAKAKANGHTSTERPSSANGFHVGPTTCNHITCELDCWTVVAHRCIVHFEDGTQLAGSTNQIAKRGGTVDPTPYLIEAGVRRA